MGAAHLAALLLPLAVSGSLTPVSSNALSDGLNASAGFSVAAGLAPSCDLDACASEELASVHANAELQGALRAAQLLARVKRCAHLSTLLLFVSAVAIAASIAFRRAKRDEGLGDRLAAAEAEAKAQAERADCLQMHLQAAASQMLNATEEDESRWDWEDEVAMLRARSEAAEAAAAFAANEYDKLAWRVADQLSLISGSVLTAGHAVSHLGAAADALAEEDEEEEGHAEVRSPRAEGFGAEAAQLRAQDHASARASVDAAVLRAALAEVDESPGAEGAGCAAGDEEEDEAEPWHSVVCHAPRADPADRAAISSLLREVTRLSSVLCRRELDYAHELKAARRLLNKATYRREGAEVAVKTMALALHHADCDLHLKEAVAAGDLSPVPAGAEVGFASSAASPTSAAPSSPASSFGMGVRRGRPDVMAVLKTTATPEELVGSTVAAPTAALAKALEMLSAGSYRGPAADGTRRKLALGDAKSRDSAMEDLYSALEMPLLPGMGE